MLLPIEFYGLNATTWLLWLFQTCSHEVLLTILILGALGVVIGVGTCLVRLVNDLLDLLIILLDLFINKTRPQSTSPSSSRVSRRTRSTDRPEGLDAARADISEERVALSQLLPLHPLQPLTWDSVDATGSTTTRLMPQAIDALSSSASRSSRPPVRRSRRTIRPRATDSV